MKTGRAARLFFAAHADLNDGKGKDAMPLQTRGPTIAKDVNRMAIYKKVKELRRTSRVEIARALQVSKNTAGAIVDELIEAGFIVTRGTGNSPNAGRKRVVIEFNAKAKWAVGAQVTPSEIHWVVTDLYAEPVHAFSHRLTSAAPAEVVAAIGDGFHRLLSEFSLDRIIGLGLGVPGAVNGRTGVSSPVLGWQNVDLLRELSKTVNAKMTLENSLHLSALGEMWYGAKKGQRNLVYVEWGEMVGASFIFEGQLYRGETGLAGGIGQFPAPGAGGGTLEQKYRLSALWGRLKDRCPHWQDQADAEWLAAVLREHHPEAVRLFKEAGRQIGLALGSLAALVDPAVIVVGGPLAAADDVWFEPMASALRERLQPYRPNPPELIRSALYPKAGCIGAAARVIQKWEDEFDHNNFRLIQSGWGGSWQEMAKKYMFKPFQEKYPSVELVNDLIGSSGDILEKIEAQRTDPQVDLVTMTELMTVRAIKAGLLQPLTPQDVPELEELHDFAKMEPYGPAILLAQIGIAYNPKRVKMPIRSWKDMLDPRCRGLIALPDMTNTSAYSFLVVAARMMGGSERDIDPGFRFMERLKDNVAVQYKTDAHVQLLLQRGEIGMAVWWNGPAYTAKKEGLDLEFVLPEEGSPTIRSMINLVKGAPHPQAAKKMIGYYISRQAQEGMVNEIFYGPVNKHVQIPDHLLRYFSVDDARECSRPIDWEYVSDHMEQWKKRWNALFPQK